MRTCVNTNVCVDTRTNSHARADCAFSSVMVACQSIRLQPIRPIRPMRPIRLQSNSRHMSATSNDARSREDKAHGDRGHGAGSPEEELSAHTDDRHDH